MILTTCAACAAPLAHDAPRCVRCHTRYCNKTCQHDHWRRGHKQICKKIHRGGNAEQYNADQKYKEAVAVAVEACAERRRHGRRSPRGLEDARGDGTNGAPRPRGRASDRRRDRGGFEDVAVWDQGPFTAFGRLFFCRRGRDCSVALAIRNKKVRIGRTHH